MKNTEWAKSMYRVYYVLYTEYLLLAHLVYGLVKEEDCGLRTNKEIEGHSERYCKMRNIHLTEMVWLGLKNAKPRNAKTIFNSYIAGNKGNRKTR